MAATHVPSPPEFVAWRFDEDWSYLADPEARQGKWWEPFKRQDLGGDAWISTGLEVRSRSETFESRLWGEDQPSDDGYALLRLKPHVDLHLGSAAQLFAQPIIAISAGVEPGPAPIDETGVDLLQAFGELRLPLTAEGKLTFRAGRQIIALGSEHMVSMRYGTNVPQAFDGVRSVIRWRQVSLDLSWSRPVRAGTEFFDDLAARDRELRTAYLSMPLRNAAAKLDLYYLGWSRDRARYARGEGREKRHTIGARFHGQRGRWSWDWEAFAQVGRFADQPIRAWSIGTETSFDLPRVCFSPRQTLRANVISGDRRGRSLGTFNAPNPQGQYFGELTPIGSANLINVQSVSSLDLGRGFALDLTGSLYWRHSLADGIYDLAGNLIRGSSRGAGRFIGLQGEVVLSAAISRELDLALSYSAFAPGDFIRDSGAANTTHFFATEARWRF